MQTFNGKKKNLVQIYEYQQGNPNLGNKYVWQNFK